MPVPARAARAAPRLRLALQCAAAGAGLPSRALLARWARAALAGLRRRRIELGVRIVGERESAALNARYRGRRGPTNVLSFEGDAPRGALLGDIVICAPLVRREARAQGKSERAHWAHLLVHGIMHLRGYDHHHQRQARVMEAREARVLARLGFPDPYR
jgi:probable rRNA maturation factor